MKLELIRADGSRVPYIAIAEQPMDPAMQAATSYAAGTIDKTVQLTADLLAGSADQLEALADGTRDPARVRSVAALFARCALELDSVVEG
jgi:hypothetical protein